MTVTWAYLAVVGGNLLAGGFDSKEACYGHRDVLQEQKIYGKCVDLGKSLDLSSSGVTYGSTGGSGISETYTFCPSGIVTVDSSGHYMCHNNN